MFGRKTLVATVVMLLVMSWSATAFAKIDMFGSLSLLM